jgi:hypothetical protein
MQRLLPYPVSPIRDLSNRPGMDAHAFMRINRIALPMVALARFPGPNKLSRQLMPSSSTMGPLTMSKIDAPPLLEEGAMRVNAFSSMASVAAITTGRYSGRQPP